MRNNYMIKKVDQIREELRTGNIETREGTKSWQVLSPKDPNRPYCITCARNFISPIAYESHLRTKVHKKRLRRIRKDEYRDEVIGEYRKQLRLHKGIEFQEDSILSGTVKVFKNTNSKLLPAPENKGGKLDLPPSMILENKLDAEHAMAALEMFSV